MASKVVSNEDMEKSEVEKGLHEVRCKMIFKTIRAELL